MHLHSDCTTAALKFPVPCTDAAAVACSKMGEREGSDASAADTAVADRSFGNPLVLTDIRFCPDAYHLVQKDKASIWPLAVKEGKANTRA